MEWGWCYATLEEFPEYVVRGSWENSAVGEWNTNGNAMKVDSKCQILRQVLKGNDSDPYKSILSQGENEYNL